MKLFARASAAWLLLFVLVGCQGQWAANYQPNPMLDDRQFPATAEVEVRTIEYERFSKYAESERQRRIDSDVAPQDLPPQEQLAAKNRLLDALQVRERGDEVLVLGWSEFTTTDDLDPYAKELRQFARKVGADIVVVTSVFRGPVTTIVSEPVTTYQHGTATGNFNRRRGPRTYSYFDTSTTYVPMQITENSYFYQAFFLRRVEGDAADDGGPRQATAK